MLLLRRSKLVKLLWFVFIAIALLIMIQSNVNILHLLFMEQGVLKAIGLSSGNRGYRSYGMVAHPRLADYLPHLANATSPLAPSVIIPSKRSTARFKVMVAFSTVDRPNNVSYVKETLSVLLGDISNGVANDHLDFHVVVMVSDKDTNYASAKATALSTQFRDEINVGLLDIIVPPANYYPPNLDKLKITLNDSQQRVAWRAKQNLDYAYLMMFSRHHSQYYLQLEDDVIASPGYSRAILRFIDQMNVQNPRWFMLEFSIYGFIGKLFRSSDLTALISTLLMYYPDKPADWLLDSVFYIRFCLPVFVEKDCGPRKFHHIFRHKPSLFKHMGKQSSAPKN